MLGSNVGRGQTVVGRKTLFMQKGDREEGGGNSEGGGGKYW